MISFLKYKWLYLLISCSVIVPGLISLFLFGLKPSIDFTGGTVWEIKFNQPIPVPEKERAEDVLKNFLAQKGVTEVTVIGSNNNVYAFKSLEIEQKQKQGLAQDLEKQFGGFLEERFESIGPTLGRELLSKTIVAIILATLCILLYIAYRFGEKSFGLTATLATLHDSLVILGLFSLFGRLFGVEVDTLFVTAVLTVLSFSVHDTIVVYDRIRELRKKSSKEDFAVTIDLAINQTLIRSLNNSLTVIFMLLALSFLGGATIRWFAAALLVGMITGTYSSIFVAAPLLSLWQERIVKR